MKLDISKEDDLLFLIDTGADISLLKGNKLIGTTEYDPEKKVKVKCVDGSPMENHGVLEARVEIGNSSIVHEFQLVNKQVDIPCDGILSRDFLKRAKAKVCYESRAITLNGEVRKMVGKTKESETGQPSMRGHINPYPTAFPYGNGMFLHFYQQQESSTTKTVHKVINKRLKTYV